MNRHALVVLAILLATAPARGAEQVSNAPPSETFDSFATALKHAVDGTVNPALATEWSAFRQRYRFTERDVPYATYRTVRLLFEATRDGGFWPIRWSITNRDPDSSRIWSQWAESKGTRVAVAECDEISALTAFLARRLGIGPIGLFWPTSNHTIAAWTPVRGRGRVLLPTTQIFLRCEEGFDDASYPGALQHTVYDYAAHDLAGTAPVAAALSIELLARFERYASASPEVWNLLRYDRHARMASSTSGCPAVRSQLVARLLLKRSREDEAALLAYARTERGMPATSTVDEVLRALAPSP